MTDKAFEGPEQDLKEDMDHEHYETQSYSSPKSADEYNQEFSTAIARITETNPDVPTVTAESVYARLNEAAMNATPERVELARARLAGLANMMGERNAAGGYEPLHKELAKRELDSDMLIIDGNKYLCIKLEDIAESDMKGSK